MTYECRGLRKGRDRSLFASSLSAKRSQTGSQEMSILSPDSLLSGIRSLAKLRQDIYERTLHLDNTVEKLRQ